MFAWESQLSSCSLASDIDVALNIVGLQPSSDGHMDRTGITERVDESRV